MPSLRKRQKFIRGSTGLISKEDAKRPLGKVRITVVEYSQDSVIERDVSSFSECLPFKENPTVTWINVGGIHEPELIESAGKTFSLHPLVVTDILDTSYLAKLEDFGTYLFAEIGVVRQSEEGGELITEQNSIVFGMNFVITFQKSPSAFFTPILDRIRKKGRICSMGADFLVYSIIDLAIDSYYKILDHTDIHIEQIEDALVVRPEPKLLREIYTLKRDMIDLRKIVWPLREIANGLVRRDIQIIKISTLPYFRDIHDYSVQIIEMVETSRDLLSGLLDVYLSAQNNRMNEVMKVLTIISTIFLPLMLLASIYGMNLMMPEFKEPMAYPVVIIVMFAVAIFMLIIFKRKRWLSNPFTTPS